MGMLSTMVDTPESQSAKRKPTSRDYGFHSTGKLNCQTLFCVAAERTLELVVRFRIISPRHRDLRCDHADARLRGGNLLGLLAL